MSAVSRYYSGSYKYDQGGSIYVHLHAKNIGRAMDGSPVNSSQISSIFRQRKKIAFQASKKQFKTLFKNSLDKKSADLLNEVFNNEDLMTELQNEMGKKFQQTLAINKMRDLMSIQRSGIATDKFTQTLLENSQESIKNFDILLDSLAKAAKLLGTQSGARLAVLLSHQHSINNSVQLGQFLSKALHKFQIQNKNKKIFMTELEIQQADQIAGNIKSLATALRTEKTNGGDPLTKSAIRRMVQSIFNTGFAESISAEIQKTAYVSLDNAFKAALTGSHQVEIEYSDQFGNAVSKSKGTTAYGKADAMFNNVKMQIQNSNKQITLNIGISDKFYKTNNFPGLKENKNSNLYSSGSGGSLTQALWSLFGSNLRYLYYAYNILGHGNNSDWSQAQSALYDVISTRQIVRLFASRGGNEDFAQFMFVNGQIVPIWNIILSTLDNISQGRNENQSVVLQIEKLKGIQNATVKEEKTVEKRLYNVNKAVQSAKIYAHLNLNNLK